MFSSVQIFAILLTYVLLTTFFFIRNIFSKSRRKRLKEIKSGTYLGSEYRDSKKAVLGGLLLIIIACGVFFVDNIYLKDMEMGSFLRFVMGLIGVLGLWSFFKGLLNLIYITAWQNSISEDYYCSGCRKTISNAKIPKAATAFDCPNCGGRIII